MCAPRQTNPTALAENSRSPSPDLAAPPALLWRALTVAFVVAVASCDRSASSMREWRASDHDRSDEPSGTRGQARADTQPTKENAAVEIAPSAKTPPGAGSTGAKASAAAASGTSGRDAASAPRASASGTSGTIASKPSWTWLGGRNVPDVTGSAATETAPTGRSCAPLTLHDPTCRLV